MKIISKLYLFLTLITILFSAGSCKKADPTNPNNCAALAQQTATNLSSSSATLKWTGSSSPYSIQYRVTGAINWSTTSSLVDSLILTGLDHSTTYEWQVKGGCNTAYSSSGTFTTTGCAPGYEGANCMTEIRAKYFGNWTESGSYTNTAGPSGTLPAMTVVKATSGSGVSDFVSTFTYNGATYSMSATLGADGKSFTIPAQTQSDGGVATGSGSFATATTVTEALVFTYTSGSTTDVVNVNLTGTKN